MDKETYPDPGLTRRFRRIIVVLIALFGSLHLLNYLLTDQCTRELAGEALRTQLRGDNPYFWLCRGEVYISDAHRMYFQLDGYDPETFETLQFRYARDKESVYYLAHVGNDMWGGDEVRIIHGADPKTFQVIDEKFSKDHQFKYVLHARGEIEATPLQK